MKSRRMKVAMIMLVGLLFVAGPIAPRYAMADNAPGVDKMSNASGTGASTEREGQDEVQNATGTGASADEGQDEVQNVTGTGASAEHEGQNEVQNAPED